MSRERPDYVGKHPRGALSSRPLLVRGELDNSHGWIQQDQWMPCKLRKKIMTRAPLTAAFLKCTRFPCCQFQCSSFIHFSVPPGCRWEIQLTFWCCFSLRKATKMQKSCCGFYLILFIIFALCLCFLFDCDDCLLLNMRFAIQSAPKSHHQADKLVASSHHCYSWPVRTLQLSKITPLYSRV